MKKQIHFDKHVSENADFDLPSLSCTHAGSLSTLRAGQTLGRNDQHSYHGIRRLRPLSRRRFKTSLPAFVLIRLRNPWVFALFLLLGRKVGCMAAPAICKYGQLHWVCVLTRESTILQMVFITQRFLECQII